MTSPSRLTNWSVPARLTLILMTDPTAKPDAGLATVLLGEPLIYYLLCVLDPDFRELFKVAVDFWEQGAYIEAVSGIPGLRLHMIKMTAPDDSMRRRF